MTPSAWAAADPPQRPVLLVNPRSGGGKAARARLPERARERGIDVVVLRPGDNLPALVDEAVADGADALGVAGGDGSLAAAAAAVLAHELPFVCVPAGTRNHFALDVGVDRADLVGALDASALSRAACLRDGGASLLNCGGLGATVARDLVCEICFGFEHVPGGAGVGLRSDVASKRRAGTR
jgi:6-phosphofructokinase